MSKQVWKYLLGLLLIAVISGVLLWRKAMTEQNNVCVIGIPEYWQTLLPPLQHSLSGFGVMINQFEPLVRRGKKGLLEPLAAKSWEFSQDRKVLRFEIDTKRKFSDGSALSAEDFKRSWEDGLQMKAKSNNSALADALANLKGFSELEKGKGISGLRAIGGNVLQLEFEKPVRSVLEHLSGVRYSAYKINGDAVVGTGPYIIVERNRELTLTPNPYYVGEEPKLKNVKIVAVSSTTAVEQLKSEKIDALLFAENAKLAECNDGESGLIKCAFGQEGTHTLVLVNGMPGRFFSNPEYRLAFQALVSRKFQGSPETWPIQMVGFKYDPQSFLRFQAGRLSDEEASAIVAEGAKYIPELIKATQAHPLRLSYRLKWLNDFLLESGIRLSDDIKDSLEAKEWLAMVYKTFEPDIMPLTGSVYDGDPDCLYHMLGRNGAIFSPMLERKDVADGLEEGRKLTTLEDLAPHYEKVSRSILKQVPYVHLGFYYRGVAYNPRRLRVNETFVGRNNQSITIFEPK